MFLGLAGLLLAGEKGDRFIIAVNIIIYFKNQVFY